MEAFPITKDFGLGSAMVFRGELITTWAYEFDFDAYGITDRMIIEAGLIKEAIADVGTIADKRLYELTDRVKHFADMFKCCVNSRTYHARDLQKRLKKAKRELSQYLRFKAKSQIADQAIAPLPIQEIETEAIAVQCEVETPYKVMVQLSMISYVQPVRYTPEALKPMQLSLV
jgi:GTPase Era involved in 16S rRNA processing